MAAVSDRLARAIPFTRSSHLIATDFADLVPARCCAAAHFGPRRRFVRDFALLGTPNLDDQSAATPTFELEQAGGRILGL